MKLKFLTALFFTSTVLISCTPEKKKQAELKKPEAIKIMDPFRFHKAIEVKPGLTLDVLSWGRGSASVGGYLILRSDSTHLNYRSESGELDGKIVDVWDMDLDSDGDPEIYIQARGEGKGSYLNMYIFEYGAGGSNQKIPFPDLSSALKKGYKGDDSIYIKEGKLIREFPVFDENDSTSAAKAGSRKIEYSLRRNSMQFKEIRQDTSEDKKP